MLESSKVHFSISFEMLGYVEFTNCSRFGADNDITAVCAEEVSLVVITSDFLATAYWAGRFCES